MGQHRSSHNLCDSNLESSWCDSDQCELSQNFCDSKLLSFRAQLFNFEIILALSISESFVAYKVLKFIFHCALSRRSTVGDIRQPADRVEHVVVSKTGTGNLSCTCPGHVLDMSRTCPYCPGFGTKYCFHGDT